MTYDLSFNTLSRGVEADVMVLFAIAGEDGGVFVELNPVEVVPALVHDGLLVYFGEAALQVQTLLVADFNSIVEREKQGKLKVDVDFGVLVLVHEYHILRKGQRWDPVIFFLDYIEILDLPVPDAGDPHVLGAPELDLYPHALHRQAPHVAAYFPTGCQ